MERQGIIILTNPENGKRYISYSSTNAYRDRLGKKRNIVSKYPELKNIDFEIEVIDTDFSTINELKQFAEELIHQFHTVEPHGYNSYSSFDRKGNISEVSAQRTSKKMTEIFSDPEMRKRLQEIHTSDKIRQKHSDAARKSWEQPKRHEKNAKNWADPIIREARLRGFREWNNRKKSVAKNK